MQPLSPHVGRPAKARSRAWVWFFVFLAAMAAAAVTLPIVYNLSLQLDPKDLDAARARWKASGPRDYDLQYQEKITQDGEQSETEWDVKVRDGRVTAAACDGEALPAAEALLGASTAGLLASPVSQGPLLAASALFPGRTAAEYANLTVEGQFAEIEKGLQLDLAAGARKNYATAAFDLGDGHPTHYVRRVRGSGERLEWNVNLRKAGENEKR